MKKIYIITLLAISCTITSAMEQMVQPNIMLTKVHLQSELLLKAQLPHFCYSLAEELGGKKKLPINILMAIEKLLHLCKQNLEADDAQIQQIRSLVIETVLPKNPDLREHFNKNLTHEKFHELY